MKSFILASSLLLFSSTIARADYEPFRFKCVYDASNDGMITATSKIDPDGDDWTFLLKSSKSNQVDKLEAKDAFVYSRDEVLPQAKIDIIEQFATKLKIDKTKWFTTTEIILFEGAFTMSFFKFNSENGKLGIGVYSKVSGEDTFTECR